MNISILSIGHLISFRSFIRLYNGTSYLLLINNNFTFYVINGVFFNELLTQLLKAVLFDEFTKSICNLPSRICNLKVEALPNVYFDAFLMQGRRNWVGRMTNSHPPLLGPKV